MILLVKIQKINNFIYQFRKILDIGRNKKIKNLFNYIMFMDPNGQQFKNI